MATLSVSVEYLCPLCGHQGLSIVRMEDEEQGADRTVVTDAGAFCCPNCGGLTHSRVMGEGE